MSDLKKTSFLIVSYSYQAIKRIENLPSLYEHCSLFVFQNWEVLRSFGLP